jgi:hypothetical protein
MPPPVKVVSGAQLENASLVSRPARKPPAQKALQPHVAPNPNSRRGARRPSLGRQRVPLLLGVTALFVSACAAQHAATSTLDESVGTQAEPNGSAGPLDASVDVSANTAASAAQGAPRGAAPLSPTPATPPTVVVPPAPPTVLPPAPVGPATVVAPANRPCTLVGCAGGVALTVTIPDSVEELRALSLEVCWNDDCLSESLDTLARTAPDIFSTGFPDGDTRDATESAGVSVSVFPASDHDQLKIAWSPWSVGALQDGDRFRFSLGRPGAEPRLVVDETVTYTVSHPSGPSCGPPCRHTSLHAFAPVRR